MEKQRILLVDDEPHITHVMSRKLARAGFEVAVARDGEEGVRTALDFRPALIISDLQMPRMDGLAFATALAEQPETDTIPVLMISGRGFLLNKELAETTRIVDVLEKPFSASDVLGRVLKILDGSGSDTARAA